MAVLKDTNIIGNLTVNGSASIDSSLSVAGGGHLIP